MAFNNTTLTTSFVDLITTVPTNTSNHTHHIKHVCYKVLYWEFPNSSVKLWDLLILMPNLLFFIYLLLKLNSLLDSLRRSKRLVCSVLFSLVLIAQALGLARCVVSMTVHDDLYSVADRVMWLLLKFFLLASELSVLSFGILFGHLDSKSSVRRVLITTFLCSLIYSSTQGVLEFVHKNDSFHFIHDGDSDYTLFGHGGMIFWFTSSFILSLLYATVCLLPFTNIFPPFSLPSKRSFYVYCGLLSFLNFMQGLGSVLLYVRVLPGLCILDVTTYFYFTCFAPFVYITFLYSFLSSKRFPSLFFSYRQQSEYMANEGGSADDDDDLLIPSNDNLDFFDDVINSQHSSYSRHGDREQDVSHFGNLDKGVLSFNNPFCPALDNHPDLSVQTPRISSPPPPSSKQAPKVSRPLVDLS